MPPVRYVAAVALGGMIGALLRVALVVMFPIHPGRWPWTTFLENVVGAFALGLVLVFLFARGRPRTLAHPLLCTGILGSFTTFSNFSVELVELGTLGERPELALLYGLASVGLGLAAAFAGVGAGRFVLTRPARRDPGAAVERKSEEALK